MKLVKSKGGIFYKSKLVPPKSFWGPKTTDLGELPPHNEFAQTITESNICKKIWSTPQERRCTGFRVFISPRRLAYGSHSLVD